MANNFDKVKFFEKLKAQGVINNSSDQLTKDLIKCADDIWERSNKEKKIEAARLNSGHTDSSYNNEITPGDGVIYSNRWDKHGRQVVDLVQEGGGMLGIALVGYTYILEKAGLSFMSLAGTSAGGINTMMIAALPDEVYNPNPGPDDATSKSEILTHIIANTHFSRFIDRKGIISKIVAKLIQPYWKVWLGLVLILFGPVLSILSYAAVSYPFKQGSLSTNELSTFLYICAFCSILFPVLVLLFLLLVVLGKNFGINPGVEFRNWVHTILNTLLVKDTTILTHDKMGNVELTKPDGTADTGPKGEGNARRLVLITSNVTFNRIVKFPEKGGDYWDEPGRVYPAEYVRATMSIPFFFEVFRPADQTNNVRVIRPSRFVDGGMLSNFPIREFNSTSPPRFPTFGVKLGLDQVRSYDPDQSLINYIFSFFNTFKEFYDNDFLSEDPEAQMLIANIDTGDANWLNFWMTKEQKQDLFCRGAQAACDFLTKFDWGKYQNIRNGNVKPVVRIIQRGS